MSNTGEYWKTEVGSNILKKKYFHEDEDFNGFLDRVSSIFRDKDKVRQAIKDADFLPAGRVLFAAGSKGKIKASLSNCYICPSPKDNLESIMNVMKKGARIASYGGGIGINISNLRPNNALVNNSAKTSSGACSFIKMYDTIGGTIGSNGRRNAMMIAMNCTHPDIEEFLKIKQNDTEIQNANLSICFTDDFMEAVKGNKEYLTSFYVPETGETVRKSINAREFFKEFCKAQYDYAEPGALWIDRINKYNLLSGYGNEYKIEVTNPCVSGDTLILTKDGNVPIKDTVGRTVNIWNGYEWSEVVPRITGHDQKMLRITFSNGATLDCTTYHKFVLSNGNRILAKDLALNMKLSKFYYPIIEGARDLQFAYTKGFYSGSGTTGSKDIAVYEPKFCVIPHLENVRSSEFQESQRRYLVKLNTQFDKDFVPQTEYTVESRLKWLAGLIDSDGIRNSKEGAIGISSINKDFLIKVQQMLMTLGCKSTLSIMKTVCQTSYRLTLSASAAVQLNMLGLTTYRVKKAANPNRNAERFITITDIQPIPDADTVYCVNEPKNHTVVFNGIMTGNCGEYSGIAYSACCLGSINLYNMVDLDTGKFDWNKFNQMVALGVRALNDVLDYGYDMQPLDENRKVIRDWRLIGLGLFGVADALIAMKLRYGSPESIEFIDKVGETMLNQAVHTSSVEALNHGTFASYDKAKVAKSPLIQKCSKTTQKYVSMYGLRNGCLLSIAPTGSIATMCGLSGGVEPLYQIKYERSTHQMIDRDRKGKTKKLQTFTVYAKSVQDAKACGKDIENEDYVVASHEIAPLDRVRFQAALQKYVDNSISSTINLKESATVEDIFSIYMKAWESGCKGITVFRDNCKRTSILGKEHDKGAKKGNVNTGIAMNTLTPPKRRQYNHLQGITISKSTACVPKMYVTVNKKGNDVYEVFTNASTGCQSNIGNITRLLSLALRCGIKVDTILHELQENTCPACATLKQQGQNVSLSCGRAIAEAVKEAQKVLQGKVVEAEEVKGSTSGNIISNERYKGHLLECPSCHKHTLRPEGKCYTCNECGYSKCE